MLAEVRLAKRSDEIGNEFILRLLRQDHAEQFELHRSRALLRVVDEAEIAREAKVEIPRGEIVETPVVQPCIFSV